MTAKTNSQISNEKKQLLAQYELHNRLFKNVLDGLTDEETNKRVNDNKQMSHIKYIAGHILNAQYGFAALGKVTVERKWDDLFAPQGKSSAKDNIQYPAIDEIKDEWKKMEDKIRVGLTNLTDEELNSEPPFPFIFDPFENTVAGFWSFLNHHQAYHIGQIGILRRGLNKEPMRYDEYIK